MLKIETTAQSKLQLKFSDFTTRPQHRAFYYVNCLENRTRPKRKVSFKWIAALKIETTAQSRLQHNSLDLTTRPQHRTFKINCLENRTRQQKKVKKNMDNCALDRDNSAVKATAKFFGLDNETTAQNF